MLSPIKRRLRQIRSKIALRYVRAVPARRVFALAYYAFLDSAFWREQVAVFAGKKCHHHESGVDAARFTLRRNIHRLEKGLIMKPMRAVFARDYIEETISAFALVSATDCKLDSRQFELKWYADVLHRYFASITTDESLTKLKEQFMRLSSAVHDRPLSAPYSRRELEERTQIPSFDDLVQLFRRRRSTRWFLPTTVPRELIDKAITAALQSPSACNRQPFKLRIFDDQSLCTKVASIPMGTAGFAVNLPLVIVVVGQLNAYFDERDRHVIYVDGALMAMSLMLALETLGLASCPINWPDVEDRESKMDSVLGLEAWERPILLIGAGFPDPTGGIPFSEKTPLSMIRSFN